MIKVKCKGDDLAVKVDGTGKDILIEFTALCLSMINSGIEYEALDTALHHAKGVKGLRMLKEALKNDHT